jgi:hypothetical protein
MKVGGRFHLTYCSNIHRGEAWNDVRDALAHSLPSIRARLAFDGPLAIGLRLSATAAESLENPDTLASFRKFLLDGDYYVFTINGFPYGAFHGQRVKEQVYLPDWRDERRIEYTNRLARLLAVLLSNRKDIEGSVSTVPGAFRDHVRSDSDVEAIASGVLRHAAVLRSLRESTGVTVTLALEPEPACYIETIGDAVDFFTRHLFDAQAVDVASRRAGLPLSVEDVRRHVGICFDACHMAVEFEDPSLAVRRLQESGVRICKIQVSSALELDHEHADSLRAALGPFAEDTYLHQVVERRNGVLRRYVDLPEALDGADRTPPGPRQWRVHFHVPIFLSTMADFQTTQPYLRSVLALLERDPFCPYLEVETYTWDVLPAQYRTVDMSTAIARELAWARAQLEP